MSEYCHTQRGYLHWILYATLIAVIPVVLLIPDPVGQTVFFGLAVLFVLLGLSFEKLTVEDGGDRLVLRYGPLPLLRKSFRYEAMTSVEPGRTTFLDGWGIHYFPGRGWTYNLWGFGCVVVRLGRNVVRIGTDEPEELAAFLNRKIAEHSLRSPSLGRK